MPTCGTAWPHTSSAPDGNQSIRLGARRRTHAPARTVMYAITAQAKCTDMHDMRVIFIRILAEPAKWART
jgi:hypothetical protein